MIPETYNEEKLKAALCENLKYCAVYWAAVRHIYDMPLVWIAPAAKAVDPPMEEWEQWALGWAADMQAGTW